MLRNALAVALMLVGLVVVTLVVLSDVAAVGFLLWMAFGLLAIEVGRLLLVTDP